MFESEIIKDSKTFLPIAAFISEMESDYECFLDLYEEGVIFKKDKNIYIHDSNIMSGSFLLEGKLNEFITEKKITHYTTLYRVFEEYRKFIENVSEKKQIGQILRGQEHQKLHNQMVLEKLSDLQGRAKPDNKLVYIKSRVDTLAETTSNTNVALHTLGKKMQGNFNEIAGRLISLECSVRCSCYDEEDEEKPIKPGPNVLTLDKIGERLKHLEVKIGGIDSLIKDVSSRQEELLGSLARHNTTAVETFCAIATTTTNTSVALKEHIDEAHVAINHFKADLYNQRSIIIDTDRLVKGIYSSTDIRKEREEPQKTGHDVYLIKESKRKDRDITTYVLCQNDNFLLESVSYYFILDHALGCAQDKDYVTYKNEEGRINYNKPACILKEEIKKQNS